MPGCLEWAEERVEECSEWRDDGYNKCDDWGFFSFLCVAWVWVSNVVCVAWTVITTAVCVVWDVVTTVINAIIVTLDSILGWVLDALAFIIELLEMIPILGTLIRWIVNFVTFLFWTIMSLGDAFLGLIGIRPEKILRVCTVILRDEKGNPVASTDFAVAILQKAVDVYKRDANVRIIPLGPFHYATGFAGAETVTSDWVSVEGGSSDSDTLDVPCNGDGAGADWLLTGSKFQWKASTNCFFGAWRRLSGYGAPVSCFIIRSIPGASGCCLWITDYATIEGENTIPPSIPRVLGHECGHACNLWHLCVDDDISNMLATGSACDPTSGTTPDYANPHMDNGQILLVRASKHVTYF